MTTARSVGTVSTALFVLLFGVESGARAQVAKLLELHGEAASDRFGRVAIVADLDQDGVEDFVVGAPRNSENVGEEAGAVYVYSGRTSELLEKFVGDTSRDTLGNAVARVG